MTFFAGRNRIDCEGGPLQVRQILENIYAPCIVTTSLTVDSDEINLYFCEGAFDEQSCYKMGRYSKINQRLWYFKWYDFITCVVGRVE